MRKWLRDIWDAVYTVAYGMWITMRYWLITYRPERKTFTEHFDVGPSLNGDSRTHDSHQPRAGSGSS